MKININSVEAFPFNRKGQCDLGYKMSGSPTLLKVDADDLELFKDNALALAKGIFKKVPLSYRYNPGDDVMFQMKYKVKGNTHTITLRTKK